MSLFLHGQHEHRRTRKLLTLWPPSQIEDDLEGKKHCALSEQNSSFILSVNISVAMCRLCGEKVKDKDITL